MSGDVASPKVVVVDASELTRESEATSSASPNTSQAEISVPVPAASEADAAALRSQDSFAAVAQGSHATPQHTMPNAQQQVAGQRSSHPSAKYRDSRTCHARWKAFLLFRHAGRLKVTTPAHRQTTVKSKQAWPPGNSLSWQPPQLLSLHGLPNGYYSHCTQLNN